MFKIVKKIKEVDAVITLSVQVLENGSCLLEVDGSVKVKYQDLEKCLVENGFVEFVSRGYYDEYRH